MKAACALLLALSLGSCNTLVGIGRDTKEGYNWTKNKIQENRAASQQPAEEEYGAPVY